MFGAFNTFGKLGSPAGSRSLLAQIQSMGASFIGIPSLSNYQDSAGTDLVTQPGGGSADPPVGLVLDLSQGLVLGPELVTASLVPYTENGTASVAAGVTTATCTTNGVYGLRTDTKRMVGGFTYALSFEVVTNSASKSSLYCYPNIAHAGPSIGPSPVIKTYNVYAPVASGTDANLAFVMPGGLVGESFSVRLVSMKVVSGSHALQSTSTARPKLSARTNLLVGTATLSTQSVTVAAGAHTMFWIGAGTVTASGAYVGALTSGQTFTTTAGTLTLTVSGSVTSAQLNTGTTAQRYQAVTDANTYDYSGFPLIHQFDAVDDAHVITFGSSLGSDCTVVTANRGTTPTIQTGQTIGTSHTISTTHAGKLIFPRALTAGETAIVTAWGAKQGAIA